MHGPDQRRLRPAATAERAAPMRAGARACGARGIRADTDAAFESALRQALGAEGPTLIHLIVDPSWGTIEQATRRAAGA